jgi:hypothetical protein
MYSWVDSDSLPVNQDYAKQRQRNEPLSEIFQVNGSSETHPLLSPHDEFANYEIFDWLAEWRRQESRPQGSYLRDALSRGLVLQREIGGNPYKYGFVGATDLHGGLSVSTQAAFAGNDDEINLGNGRPSRDEAAEILLGKRREPVSKAAGGLTGVWAESNTREAIYDALRRRETFATSGTRLKFRFFGGWSFDEALLQKKNWIATAYANGVPMGGELPTNTAREKVPTFVIWAVKDPNGVNLERAQIIKVWEQNGQQEERIFDVAWSAELALRVKRRRLASPGDTVDLKAGRHANSSCATELQAGWKDPEFNPQFFSAYYLRVLEVPTARWSTLLAAQYGLPLPKDVPAAERQRGCSSPIWYTPQAPAN